MRNDTGNNSRIHFGTNSLRQLSLLNEVIFGENRSAICVEPKQLLRHPSRRGFALHNPGRQFASRNFSSGSNKNFSQPYHILSHRFGHSRSPYWIGTRIYLCHLFHAPVLSTSFVIKICCLDAIWALFFRVLRLYITINCLCLHINAIYRSCIASEVRLHDYKEESFH